MNWTSIQKLFQLKKNLASAGPQRPLPSLAACLLMDVLGYASYAVPFLGEALDIVWAPVSAFIFFRMFGGARGLFGGLFNFAEELFPFTDFIPTFTITWLFQAFANRKSTPTPRVINVLPR